MEPSTTETSNQKEEEKEPTLSDKLRSMLNEFPNAPSTAEIDSMKAKHGDVYLSALNDDEVFLFRSLTRKEHRLLQQQIAENKLQGEAYEETLVNTCLLWKSDAGSLESKAGTIPSLFEQIMQNSNFLSPQLLTNLVTKL